MEETAVDIITTAAREAETGWDELQGEEGRSNYSHSHGSRVR